MELIVVSIAQVAEKIDLPLAVGEKLRVQLIGVETGHRPAIQSQSACGQDEVCGLQRTVAEGGLVNKGVVADKKRAHIELRKEPGKILVEFGVPGDDDGDGSGHSLVDIAGCQNWLE